MDNEELRRGAYRGTCEYSPEDDLWYGRVTAIQFYSGARYPVTDLVTYEAESKEGLQQVFEKAVNEYIEFVLNN